MKSFLHVGCGAKRKDQTTRGFNTPELTEIRLDIDASVCPDVVGTMTDMGAVASESVDAIFSSHNIEHLYPHEVPAALGEFLRVLRPDGFVVITCPDLQSVCALVAEDKLTEPAYTSPAGPIAPLDIPSMALEPRWLKATSIWPTAVGLHRRSYREPWLPVGFSQWPHPKGQALTLIFGQSPVKES